MSVKEKFVTMRDNYVINQVKKAQLPEFGESESVRYKFVFSGRVQHVGFRLEVCELAKRLGLTGFCQNLDNGDVLTQIQGAEEKINYLVSFMESLRRIKITGKTVEKLELNTEETEFVQRG